MDPVVTHSNTNIAHPRVTTESNVPTNNAQPSVADAKLSDEELKFRKISKTLADYMMYLLNRQPVMMFAVAGISEVRYRDTCAEANIFFDRVMPKQKNETMETRMRTACKSVLFDAVQLAKALKVMRQMATATGMWEPIAKVWVELLSYSAMHTRASAHAARLKQGGQLLTLVWLLMVHLGLGKQFRITQGHARSKLIISK
ncbi:hypothetical protein V2J09_006385 [Rumex salicifolius]